MATTSKRLFTYLLSIIGLDRIAHSTTTTTNTNTNDNNLSTTTTTTSSSSSSTLSNDSYNSSKTNVSFMSESTLFVNADIAGLFDEKFVQDAGIHMIPYDTWSLQTWMNGLSRMALCQIITTTAMKCPRIILQMIEEYQPSTQYHQKLQLQEQEQTNNHPINDYKNQENKNSFCHYQEILTIQKRAQFIIHSLDHLRPSEQFANEPELAQEIQSLVRWCTNILHTSTTRSSSSSSSSSSSLVTLVGLLVIAREGLSAIPEIRKYLFGKAYLGRMVILEMSSVLKNFKESPLHSNSNNLLLLLPYQWSLLLRILDPPQHIIQASYHYQVSWLIQFLSDICHQMASCDKEWFYFQEYDNVITIATRNYGGFL
ncbi:hypothetical protein INT45_005870 [Circinella minor]|uniref:Uncharacterized protein n=1 Tax=Circinella minor TaxID=1195481 RepID=A0A8H7RYD9_9FUNG|nr:hypothetical protein INT45_005870 [Circinella minor]